MKKSFIFAAFLALFFVAGCAASESSSPGNDSAAVTDTDSNTINDNNQTDTDSTPAPDKETIVNDENPVPDNETITPQPENDPESDPDTITPQPDPDYTAVDNDPIEPSCHSVSTENAVTGYVYSCYQQGGAPGFGGGCTDQCSDCKNIEVSGGNGGYVKAYCYTSQMMDPETMQPSSKYFIACVITEKSFNNGGCKVIFNMNGTELDAEDPLYRHDDEVSYEEGTNKMCGEKSEVSVSFKCQNKIKK